MAEAEKPADTAPTTPPAPPLDEFGQQLKERLSATIDEHNKVVGQLKATQGDPSALIETLRSTPVDDANITKAQEKYEKLYTAWEQASKELDDLLKPYVEKVLADSKGEVERLEDTLKALADKIRSGLKYFVETYGDANASDLPKVESKRGTGVSAGSGAGASGQRRIRGFDFYVNGTLATMRNAQGEDRSNMAAAAKVVGVDNNAMRDAFFKAQGTDDSSKYQDKVTFTVSHDGKEFTVLAVRQAEPTGAEASGKPADNQQAAS